MIQGVDYDFESTDPKYRPVPLARDGRVRKTEDNPYFEAHHFYSEKRRLDEKRRIEEMEQAETLRSNMKQQIDTLSKFSRRERALDRTVTSHTVRHWPVIRNTVLRLSLNSPESLREKGN